MRGARLTIGGLLPAAGLPVAAAEGGGLAEQLITPHIGTFVWTALTFLIMLFLLRKYAWSPLLGALGAREKGIQDSLEQSRRQRQEAQDLLEQQRELLAEAHRQRAQAVEEGRRDADKLKTEIVEEAKSQRERLLKQTQEQVEAGLRQARGEFRGVAAELAIRAAEKLLARNLDDETQRKLVEEYLVDLEKSGGSVGRPS